MAHTLTVDFERDDAKDLSNQRKHGLSFAEARQLFESEQALYRSYMDHYK